MTAVKKTRIEPPTSTTMSSTLFGGGVMTQVGVGQRTEATEKAIKEIRTELASLRSLPTQIRSLEAILQNVERKLTALETEVSSLKASASSNTSA